jgi:hypothetical protein
MNKIIIGFIVLFLVSCGDDKFALNSHVSHLEMDDEEVAVSNRKTPKSNNSVSLEKSSQKLIREGRMAIKVEDLHTSKKMLDELLSKSEGYYLKEKLKKSDYNESYDLKIRIPASKFDGFLISLEGNGGVIEEKVITVKDVTEEFFDLNTRQKNKEIYLDKYRDLLLKSKNIDETLKVQELIRALEEEIERVKGRLKYINDKVDYSTLSIYLYENKTIEVKEITFLQKLGQSLNSGWNFLITFTLGVITFWPFWILLVVVIILVRKYRRKKNNVH